MLVNPSGCICASGSCPRGSGNPRDQSQDRQGARARSRPRYSPAPRHWILRISFQARPALPRLLLPLLIAWGYLCGGTTRRRKRVCSLQNIQLPVQLMAEALDAAPSAELLALKTTVRGLLAYSAPCRYRWPRTPSPSRAALISVCCDFDAGGIGARDQVSGRPCSDCAYRVHAGRLSAMMAFHNISSLLCRSSALL